MDPHDAAPPPPPTAPAPGWPPTAVAVEVVEPLPATRHDAPAAESEHGHRGVALLLAATAIVAAIVAAASSSLSSSAGDTWQSALRTEAKRSAAAMKDIQTLYQTEVPQVLAVLSARAQEAQLRAAAASATGAAQQALATEADAQKAVADTLAGSVDLAGEAYALPDGSVNLSARLTDIRGKDPALVALDPDAIMAEGDVLAARATSITFALWPLAFAALFGAMAEPFRRQRRLLLALGTVSFAVGVVVAAAAGMGVLG